MRLLNTTTLRVTEVPNDSIPPYAILSHTWVPNEELSLQDLDEVHRQPQKSACHPLTLKQGYQKIAGCCDRALRDGLEWAWVDTCCIDKTSSSELSEAINSMFRWYQNSRVCYTLLSDVSDRDELSERDSEFRRSRWFTRGWTLQELLAPKDVLFFSKSWTLLGNRSELCELASEVTRIPSRYLRSSRDDEVSAASIAQRMSWAATRSTTRREDLAYCLLGIFGVNMPLLYGEGDRAFRRLQEEIVKQTNDSSIFAWGYIRNQSQTPNPSESQSYLASSPSNFVGCDNIVIENRFGNRQFADFELTKRGLRITIPLAPETMRLWKMVRSKSILGVLNCRPSGDLFNVIAIPLTWIRYTREGSIEVVRQSGPPVLCPRRLLRWPVLKTIYIVEQDTSNNKFPDRLAQDVRAAGGASLIIPAVPYFSIEALASSPALTLGCPAGLDHYAITDTGLRAPSAVKGNAYLRFQQSIAQKSDSHVDFLVNVAFEAAPSPDPPSSSPAEHTSTYLPGPNRLRRKTEHWTRAVWKQRRNEEQRLLAGGQAIYQRSDGMRGKINCFVSETPQDFRRHHHRGLEYFESIVWGTAIMIGDRMFEPAIETNKAGHEMILKNDDYDRRQAAVWHWILTHLIFDISLQKYSIPPFVAFVFKICPLGILACCFVGISIDSNNIAAGSTWMVTGMGLVAIAFSQPRPGYDIHKLLLSMALFCSVVTATALTIAGNSLGSFYLIALFVFAVTLPGIGVLLLFWEIVRDYRRGKKTQQARTTRQRLPPEPANLGTGDTEEHGT